MIQAWDRSRTGSARSKEATAAPLFNRYNRRIVAPARKRLGGAAGLDPDEKDAALNVFVDLFDGAPQGKFLLLDNRDDPWRLLAFITARKVADLKYRITPVSGCQATIRLRLSCVAR